MTTGSYNALVQGRDGGRGLDELRFLQLQQRERSKERRLGWLAVIVALLPVAGAAIFIWFVATPMYSAETRFAVRGGDNQVPVVGTLLSTGGAPTDLLGGFVDGYAVRDFLQSREAMEKIEAKINFAALAVRPQADPLVRLPADATRDQLYAAYKSMVSVRYNMIEQIVVTDVLAFTPEDAVTLSKAVVEVSETFADDMNRRARENVLKVAEDEVSVAEDRALKARLTVGQWRNENSNIDPSVDATMVTNLIAQLEQQLSASQDDLNQIKVSSPNQPRRRSVESEIASLRQQIADQRKRLGGPDTATTRTTAAQMSSYESLKATQDFADANLVALRQSLEQARIAMFRQQKFVAVIAAPLIDRRPAYPEKPITLLSSLIGGIALAFFGSVLIGLFRGILFG